MNKEDGCNAYPSRKDYEFIEKFAKANNILYDPNAIIDDALDTDDGELEEYFDDFNLRHGEVFCDIDDEDIESIAVQLTLWELLDSI